MAKENTPDKITNLSYKEKLIEGWRSMYDPLSFREKLIFGFVAIFIVGIFIAQNVGATVSDLGSTFSIPSATCVDADSWSNPHRAAAQPDVEHDGDRTEITQANSATWTGALGTLDCFGYQLENDHFRINNSINLSLRAINESTEEIFEDEIGLSEAVNQNILLSGRAESVVPNLYGTNLELSTDSLLMISASSDKGQSWTPLHILDNSLLTTTEPHISIALPDEFSGDLDNLAIRVEAVAAGVPLEIYIDAVNLTYEVGKANEVSIALLDETGREIKDELPVIGQSEQLEIELSSKDVDDGLWQGLRTQVTGQSPDNISATSQIIDEEGDVVSEENLFLEYVDTDLSNRQHWSGIVDLPKQSTPGQYSLRVQVVDESGRKQSITQDFLWGVLAANTNKSIYKTNETAEFAITVLDENGATICDPLLNVRIDGPGGAEVYSTDNQTITRSDTCFDYGDHIVPDFHFAHQLGEEGVYRFTVVAETANGQYRISDQIVVDDSSPLYVERVGPTRVYPPITYPMRMIVKAEQDFNGTIEEFVPKRISIRNRTLFAQSPSAIVKENDQKVIRWQLNLEAGEEVEIGYDFKVPPISPEFYLLGPLQANSGAEKVFEEYRSWQLAGDAVGDYAIYYDSNGTHETDNAGYTGVPFNNIVSETGAFTQNANDIDVDLGDTGHYLYGYNVQARNDTYANRISYRTRVTVGGSEDVTGHGQGYRRNATNDRYYSYGYGIVDATSGDDFRVEAIRHGTFTASHLLEADRSSLWLIKLDDTWDYLMLQGADNQATTTGKQNIDFTTQNEYDTGSFTHETVTNPDQITLDTAGHYLVTYNVGVDNSSNRTSITTNLELDGVDVPQSFDYVYIRNSDGTDEGTATNMSIISASAGDILELEWGATGADSAHSTETMSARTAITIVKIPDFAHYLRVYETTDGQDVGGNGTNVVSYDTQVEADSASFSYATTGVTTVQQDATYLFTSGARNNRGTTGTARMTAGGAWFIDGARQEVGNTGQFVRGDQGTGTDTFDGGWSAAGLFEMTEDEEIDFREIDDGDNGNADVFQPDEYGITAVNIDSLFATDPNTDQLHFRWRDDTTDLNTSGGFMAAEDSNAIGDIDTNTTIRLRMEVANNGISAESAARQYELQFANGTGISCSSATGWVGVADSGSDAIEPVATTHITPDGEATTSGILANSEGYTRINGEGREALDTTGNIGPLSADNFTELEYSIEATSNALAANKYCFRLYDQAGAGSELDSYSVFPEITISATIVNVPSGLGEAGSFTSTTDGSWTTINYLSTYTTPVVVGTSNAAAAEDGLIFEARNVGTTSAEMRLCKSQGPASTGCDTMTASTVGYMVIDANVVDNFDGIEAGTFVESGQVDTSTTVTNYTESFSASPLVFTSVQTVDGDDPIEVRVTTTSTASFTAGLCQQNSTDGCDGSHGNETVGWVAIEPGNAPFAEEHDSGSVGVVNSAWTAQSFSPAFTAVPVALVEAQTNNGGQEVEIDEATDITINGMDVRYCELDATDDCDTHTTETVGWFAVESGQFTQDMVLDQDNFRVYENEDAIQPTTPIDAEDTGVSNIPDDEILRFRIGVQAGLASLGADLIDFKLQYAQSSNCSAAGSWTDVGAAGSSDIWRGYDNTTPADGADITSTLLTASDDNQSYVEENNSPLNPNAIDQDDSGEWDWVVQSNGATEGTDYCFRMALSDGTEINYSQYVTVSTLALPTEMYLERDTSFTASTGSAWTTIDLSSAPHSIPRNRVVEIAIGNENEIGGTTVGVRSVGNTDDRFIELRETEGGGADPQGSNFLVLHTQLNNDGELQYYTSDTANTTFYVLGYWENGTFVDSWDNFNPGADTTWTNIDLSGAPYNVPVNRVVEITAANGEDAVQNDAGIQRVGGPDTRLVDLAEAELPTTSYTTWTAFAQADQNSQIEVYAQDDSEMEFYFTGYWDIQPGHFTELDDAVTNPTLDNTWQVRDVSGAPWNVPGEGVVEMTMLQGDNNAENDFGTRANVTTLNRQYLMMEAEAGGFIPLRLHAPTNTDSEIEIIHEDVSDIDFQYLVTGFWEPDIAPNNPTSLSQTEVDDTVITTGQWINFTTVEFKATISDTEVYEALRLCVEIQPLGTAFTSADTACSAEYAYNGTDVNAEVTIVLPDQDEYHWQARVIDVAAEYSSYVSYGGNGEAERDVGVDTTAPTGGVVYDGTTPAVDVEFNNGSLDELSANWDSFDPSISGLDFYEYSIGTTPGGTDVLAWQNNGTSTTFTESSLTLNTSQPYYTNVRITDNATNQSTVSSDGQLVSPTLSFSTTPGEVSFANLNAGNGFTDTEVTVIDSSTNAYNGYVVRAYSNGLLTSQAADTIGMFDGGTYVSPDEWLPGDTGWGLTSSDNLIQGTNIFNPVTCAGGGSSPCYVPVSLTAPGDIIADNQGLITGSPITNEQFNITHRVTTSSSQEAGTYSSVIIYSITAIY